MSRSADQLPPLAADGAASGVPADATANGVNGQVVVLPAAEWRAIEASYQAVVDELTAGQRRRQQLGTAHPVEDFLFSYYRLRPAQLRRWHPGAGWGLAAAPDHAAQRFYRTDAAAVTTVDVAAFVAERAETVALLSRLLPATAAAPAQFGCFGLHEWAMVHRQSPTERRHSSWPLRLGATGTDEVVRSHQLKCSHFDAFRFFTAAAKPLNVLQPTVWTRAELEQPGCLHGNMDLYKWAYKLLPVAPSGLVLDCFLLAREIRELDMRASPYDLSELGYTAVAVETADGKAEYVAAQRGFAARAAVLRNRLIEITRQLTRPA